MGNQLAIVILGGTPVKDANGKWRGSTFFDSGDNFGITGDRLRALAASFLAAAQPEALLIASGGKGQLANIADAPPVAKVIRDELLDLGILNERIILEDQSGTTYEQLLALKNIIQGNNYAKVLIISNQWHLPRIKAMLDYRSELRELSKLTSLELVSAEETVIKHDPHQKEAIRKAYQSQAMLERLELERRGINQIIEGTYRYA